MKAFAKTRLKDVLDALAADATVWVPAVAAGGGAFLPWGPGVEPTLDTNPRRGPKAALFPATEKVYRYDLAGGEASVTPLAPAGRTVLFAVRSCDAAAIKILDEVMLDGGCAETCYAARRGDSVIFALACRAAGTDCFCASLGIDPADCPEADVQMYDMGVCYGVAARTEAGQRAVAGLAAAGLLEDAAAAASPAAEGQATMPDAGALAAKLEKMFDHPLWEELAARCLGCGACTYVCPACHCFDLTDAKKGVRSGYKLRAWDSCMAGEYTRMAGGHNPRPGRKERVRQRFMHKLCYGPARHGRLLCTGCGRCRSVCPVNIDIMDVMQQVREAATDGKC